MDMTRVGLCVVALVVACSLLSDLFACFVCFVVFFFNDTATTEIYTLSLHDALPILGNHWNLQFLDQKTLKPPICK